MKKKLICLFTVSISLFSPQFSYGKDKDYDHHERYTEYDHHECYNSREGCFSHPLRSEREKTLTFDEWAEAHVEFEKTRRERYKGVTEFETKITKVNTSESRMTMITENKEKIFLACERWAYNGYGGYRYPAVVLTPHTDTPIITTKLGLKPLFYQKVKTNDCKAFVDRVGEELRTCTSNESQVVMRVNFNTGLEIISDCVSKENSWTEELLDQYERKVDFL